MKQRTILINQFPQASAKILPGGMNLYFDNILVTVYFKKRKYAIENVWKHYNVLEDLIAIINEHLKPTPVKSVITSFSIGETHFDIQTPSNTVDQVISHIKKKIQIIESSQRKPDTVLTLMLLIDEIKQFK